MLEENSRMEIGIRQKKQDHSGRRKKNIWTNITRKNKKNSKENLAQLVKKFIIYKGKF